MKIGVLSDTHNDSAAIQRALQVFRQRGVRTLIHCGDLATSEMVGHFDGFEVYFVRGNMDRRQVKALKAAIKTQPKAHWLGKGREVELDSRMIAVTHGDVTHGDREDVLDALFSIEPDYLLHGHTHRRRDEWVGPTRVINPGALGGTQYEARSICILDLATDRLEVICF
jgi:putative phosphoesterase